jgi:NTE family protein
MWAASPSGARATPPWIVLLRTFTIMGTSIGRLEMADADLVIRPATPDVDSVDFDGRHAAILAGEKAAAALLPELKAGWPRRA